MSLKCCRIRLSETKIDESFHKGIFLIYGFSAPYRLDQNSNGNRPMLFVREVIGSNPAVLEPRPIEVFYIELNLRNDNGC